MKHLPSTAQERPSRRLWPGPVFNRTVIVAGGVFYASSGLALLVAPAWFYRTVGPFPPFNRHYSGDLGAFLLPLGVGLLFAAVDGTRHRLVLLVAAGGSVLHALNHVYDAVREAADPLHLAAARARRTAGPGLPCPPRPRPERGRE